MLFEISDADGNGKNEAMLDGGMIEVGLDEQKEDVEQRVETAHLNLLL